MSGGSKKRWLGKTTDDGSAGETTTGRRELVTFTVAKRGCASRSVPGTKVNANLAAEDEDG